MSLNKTGGHVQSGGYLPAILSLALVCLFALYLRLPYITASLPFFYEEDEGHHFNRVVNMVKRGEFNPRYFHKPSLHFYLRMPAVSAGFLWGVHKGFLRSLKEIKTADRYGLAGYAFTVSHPTILKWTRAESVLFSILLVVATFLLTLELTQRQAAALLAAGICAISPPLVSNSAVVGVDILMALMAVSAVYLCVLLARRFSLLLLAAAGAAAGLAVSSKYNALPVALVPLIAVLVTGRITSWAVLIALIAPAAGFLLGSPFVLAELPLFLDQLAYEIWHYGIAGHAGNEAQPGLPQFFHYMRWLFSDALGALLFVAACTGLVLLLLRKRRAACIGLAFPVLFLLLMVSQKANFARNVLVLVPFAALAAGEALAAAAGLLPSRRTARGALAALAVIACIQPLLQTVVQQRAITSQPESRIAALAWLEEQQTAAPVATGIAGQLQLPPAALARPAITVIDEQEPLDKQARSGLVRVVLRAARELTAEERALVEVEKSFPGEREHQRIPKNPGIEVYRFKRTQ